MTLLIELEPAEEAQLIEHADAAGVTPSQFLKQAVLLTEDEAEDEAKRLLLISMIDVWKEEAAAASPEELETADREWRDTMRALDEDREGYRRLFPELTS